MKIYVREGQATFICEDCNVIEIKHMTTHNPHIAHTCKKCGFITSCNLCYRKTYRKVCDIDATLRLNPNTKIESKYPIKIIDLSLHGYRLRLLKKTPVGIGDVGIVEYVLPSKKKSKISQEIEIRSNIQDDVEMKHYSEKFGLIGAKCINVNHYSEQQKTKGFWLMP